MRTLNLSFGVNATFAPEGKTKKELFQETVTRMVQTGDLAPADTIAYLTGSYRDGNLRTTLEISTVQEEMRS